MVRALRWLTCAATLRVWRACSLCHHWLARSLASPGKHGHAKANITALDIFTNNKYMDICPTSHNMEAPFVTTTNFSLVDIDEEEFCCLMDEEGNTREDLQFPEGDDYEPLRKAFEEGSEVIVTVQAALDTEKIMPTFKIGKA